MGRPELGNKCTCTGCSERFYDLHRLPAICPKCGSAQRPPQRDGAYRIVAGSRRPHRAPDPIVADDDPAPSHDTEADGDEEDEALIDADEDDEAGLVIEAGHDAAA